MNQNPALNLKEQILPHGPVTINAGICSNPIYIILYQYTIVCNRVGRNFRAFIVAGSMVMSEGINRSTSHE